MVFYTVDNPAVKPVQEWNIPTDSVVYAALKPNAFPNLKLKVLDMDDGQWTISPGQAVEPNSGSLLMWVGGSTWYNLYSQNGMILCKVWVGNVPFSRTVNAKVHGYTITNNGVKTETVSRGSFIVDETTYLVDQFPLSFDWNNPTWNTASYLCIFRNSNEEIIDYALYHYTRTVPTKVGKRIQNIAHYVLFEDSGFIINNPTVVPKDISSANFASVGNVEITDFPDLTFTLADPVTVPITINSQEKAFCYIEF